MSQPDGEPEEALEAWSIYREMSEAIHSDSRKAVKAFAYLA
jgi:hypothetical protein